MSVIAHMIHFAVCFFSLMEVMDGMQKEESVKRQLQDET